jgi:hypothetical protein
MSWVMLSVLLHAKKVGTQSAKRRNLNSEAKAHLYPDKIICLCPYAGSQTASIIFYKGCRRQRHRCKKIWGDRDRVIGLFISSFLANILALGSLKKRRHVETGDFQNPEVNQKLIYWSSYFNVIQLSHQRAKSVQPETNPQPQENRKVLLLLPNTPLYYLSCNVPPDIDSRRIW